MPDQPTPQILNGRYRVERELARGGMAQVLLGEDLVLHRPVALKVLVGELSRDEGFVERFRREARAAAGLNHPNIVAVYDWGEVDDGSYFIVMEYVLGETLAQLLRGGPLPAERTAVIGAEIADALSAAHRQGVVHRDVKPGNVLIDPSGNVKVTDFGIAQAGDLDTDNPLTRTGMVLGTAAYLSPEQAQGRPADARSDVYALGVVLYEMATGRAPFRGDTPLSVAYQHVSSPPEAPRSLNPAVPVWLQQVILRALAKDPAERYASAADLRAALLEGPRGQTFEATVPLAGLAGAGAVDATRVYDPVAGAAAGAGVGAAGAAAGAGAAEAAAPVAAERHSNGRARAILAALLVIVIAALVVGIYLATRSPSKTLGTGSTTTSTTASTTSRPSTTTSPTTTSPPSSTLPSTFAGYVVSSGSGASALYCPSGVALGSIGQAGPAGNGQGGTPGASGGGGSPGCGSNGGNGGQGGNGAAGAAGGAGGHGGNGGCPPATLAQMRAGDHPCAGTGSDGGSGGNGGNAAPAENGGAGGGGGHGGNTQRAKGGNGGNGGNATLTSAGAAGGPGQPGGGANGTTAGVNGQNGANGQSGKKGKKPKG